MPGDVERFVRVQKPVGRAGTWQTVPNCDKLPVWAMSVAEAAEPATGPAKRYHFHVGFVDGIAKGCRVVYLGQPFNVVDVSDSTRLRGLELRCIASNP